MVCFANYIAMVTIQQVVFFDEKGQSVVCLKATGTYPEGLAKLFVLSLMLKYQKSRSWVVSNVAVLIAHIVCNIWYLT